MVQQWLSRLGLTGGEGAPRPTKVNDYRIDATPPRSWVDVLPRKSRGITKEVIVEGCTVTETITIKPMSREDARREAAAWYNGARPSQWRRVR